MLFIDVYGIYSSKSPKLHQWKINPDNVHIDGINRFIFGCDAVFLDTLVDDFVHLEMQIKKNGLAKNNNLLGPTCGLLKIFMAADFHLCNWTFSTGVMVIFWPLRKKSATMLGCAGAFDACSIKILRALASSPTQSLRRIFANAFMPDMRNFSWEAQFNAKFFTITSSISLLINIVWKIYLLLLMSI